MEKVRKLKKFKNLLITTLQIVLIIFVTLILFASIRGNAGIPTAEELNNPVWKEQGPFELSPERGRYALTYSIIEDKSFDFSIPVARFTTPDLGYTDGKFVSLFAPGVSFLVIPGYVVGHYLGMSQVGAYSAIAVYAILNFILIRQISKLLGASNPASVIAGMTFIFATPAFAYGVSLYQHHISTFLILLATYLLVRFEKKWLATLGIWFLCGLGIAVDNPNLLMMMPIGIVALLQSLDIEEKKEEMSIRIYPKYIIAIIGVLIPALGFMYFNYVSYGNPLQLGGTTNSVDAINEEGEPVTSEGILTPEELAQAGEFEEGERSSVGFFEARDMVNGLYIHLFSEDRGVVYFTPVILTGIIGIFVLYRSKNKHLPLLLSIVGVNLILYSMWGDPWGGWAFGSRYLIPSYAIMSIFIAMALTRYSRNILFLLVFAVLFVYSTAINTLGAITTSAIPPKVQAIPLEALTGKEEKYNYKRSWDFLNNNGSKSYFYQEFLEDSIPAKDFYITLVSAISTVSLMTLIGVYLTNRKTKDENKD